ncbi:uncharacterized protein SCODWIG_01998 [Saccharomycodes ludwigii]|uniref:J domain-containing protein APJ1 n=1 Tax=Saccharomycodes ludwigii TaxID=36035 RepID=A0A376B6A7_9ASCO|nr:uncharacterized protein SCODWIG_01998 [Saccharomycodes ludwigii]
MTNNNNLDYYSILEVSKKATLQEIKKAYKLKALKYHPDKNNHSEESKTKFQEICVAYEVLTDTAKRNKFDKYGTIDDTEIYRKQQLQRQKQRQQRNTYNNSNTNRGYADTGMSAADIFSQFFGSDPFFSHHGYKNSTTDSSYTNTSSNIHAENGNESEEEEELRGPDINHNLKCTLDDLYLGKSCKLAMKRSKVCVKCQGTGGSRSISSCNKCQGKGVITDVRKMGPLIQSWSSTCKYCHGTGEFTKFLNVCNICNGQGYVSEKTIFDVKVERGMKNGSAIILPGQADEVIETEYGHERVIPGDVIITLTLSDDRISRGAIKLINNGQDLYIPDFKVDLKTSLCGGTIFIPSSIHPKKILLKITVLPGELLKPGCVKNIENLGMPIEVESKQYGNLYIKFSVQYPDKLNTDTIVKLSDIFDKDENVMKVIKSCEQLNKKRDINETFFNKNSTAGSSASSSSSSSSSSSNNSSSRVNDLGSNCTNSVDNDDEDLQEMEEHLFGGFVPDFKGLNKDDHDRNKKRYYHGTPGGNYDSSSKKKRYNNNSNSATATNKHSNEE